MAKKYSSYSQINADLELLKLKKKIHLQHILLNIDKTKKSLHLDRLFHEAIASLKFKLFNSFGVIMKTVIPYLINWFINKKRGD